MIKNQISPLRIDWHPNQKYQTHLCPARGVVLDLEPPPSIHNLPQSPISPKIPSGPPQWHLWFPPVHMLVRRSKTSREWCCQSHTLWSPKEHFSSCRVSDRLHQSSDQQKSSALDFQRRSTATRSQTAELSSLVLGQLNIWLILPNQFYSVR